MKVALVHDYLNEFGGAERVLLALSEIYPDAPIYTIFKKEDSPAGKAFKNKKVIESWFSEIPFYYKLISPLRFLVPVIWKSFNFKKYDLVITSASWAVTKGMKNAKREICYLHTPPRYLWGYDSSRNWENYFFAGAIKLYSLIVNHFMRMYDFDQAQKPDFYIVNSENIARRLKKFYRRDDYKVIYPPIDVKRFGDSKVKAQEGGYYLTGGRLVAAKNFDKIIKASEIAEVNLKIFGTGILEEELKRKAGENIEFVGRVSDKKLVSLYKGAKAFIVAQKDEDFGMTPVEAAAAGTPTIAYKAEGYLESVVEGKTGLFFEKLNSKSIARAIEKSEKKKWIETVIKNHAKKFSEENFKKQIKSVISKHA